MLHSVYFYHSQYSSSYNIINAFAQIKKNGPKKYAG